MTKEKMLSRTITDFKGCMLWQGAKCHGGYGNVGIWNKKTKSSQYLNTHRLMWELCHGKIPKDMFVLHHCDEPSCINPDHLFIGTQEDNLAIMRKKNRHSSGTKHSEAIKKGWTPEVRNKHSKYMVSRRRKEHLLKAELAGANPNHKYCPKCDSWYSHSNFYKNSARKDGLKNYCKKCSVTLNNERLHRKKYNL